RPTGAKTGAHPGRDSVPAFAESMATPISNHLLGVGAEVVEDALADEGDGRRSMGEERVVKALEREAGTEALLGLVTKREDLHLAERVGEVAGVEGAAEGLLASGRLVLVAVLDEAPLGLGERHLLGVEPQRDDDPAVA